MALHSIPLLMPEGPPPLHGGVDVYLLECHHVQRADDDGVEANHFRSMALLVSLSATQSDRAALLPLRHALAFGRCTEFSSVDWSERLAERVAALRPEFATAVVFAGSSAVDIAETVQTSVDTLRRLLGSALALVVVVSGTAESLASLDGVSGFVCGVHSTDGDTARQVYLALASLHACETLNGIDILDLLPVLGRSSAPTVLAEALWLRTDDGCLLYPSAADKHTLTTTRRSVAVPIVRDATWGELRRLQRAVREGAHEAATSVVFAPNNALTPGLLPASIGWVLLLCAPSPTAKEAYP